MPFRGNQGVLCLTSPTQPCTKGAKAAYTALFGFQRLGFCSFQAHASLMSNVCAQWYSLDVKSMNYLMSTLMWGIFMDKLPLWD